MTERTPTTSYERAQRTCDLNDLMWPRALALFLSRVDFYFMLSRKEEAAAVVCCVVEDNHSDAPGPWSLSAVLILHQLHPLLHPEQCACWQECEIEQHMLQPRWSRAAVSVPTVTQLFCFRFSYCCTLVVSYHHHSTTVMLMWELGSKCYQSHPSALMDSVHLTG